MYYIMYILAMIAIMYIHLYICLYSAYSYVYILANREVGFGALNFFCCIDSLHATKSTVRRVMIVDTIKSLLNEVSTGFLIIYVCSMQKISVN